jgi:putative sigma-54 modulation protein
MDITIQAIQFKADEKLQRYIEERLEKLSKYYQRIRSVQVFLRLDNKKAQIKDKVVEVKIELPRTTLFATQSDKTFEGGAREAVKQIKSQLKRHADKLKD